MLKSLYVFGRYRGGVLVLADRPETEVAVPDEMAEMVRILCYDAIGSSTRFQIQEFIGACDTPVLHIDSDIIVAQEVDPILRKMPSKSGIYVSSELGLQPQFADVPASAITDEYANWFGLELFLEDPELRDRPLQCLNAGLFGYSERRKFEQAANQIHDMYTSHRRSSAASRYGTDQPYFNYVLAKLGSIDSSLLNSTVSFVKSVEGAVRHRRPFVHFLWPKGDEKAELMSRYMSFLESSHGGQHKVDPAPVTIPSVSDAPAIAPSGDYRVRFYGDGEGRFGKLIKALYDQLNGAKEQSTELCEIMTQEGSDKGKGWHNYTILYDLLFRDHRRDVRRLFEVGIGGSIMASAGVPGASLRGWRTYFPNAHVIGADVNQTVLFSEARISTYYVDQLREDSITDLWNELADVEFDVIIDDGLHTFEANSLFMSNSIHKLARKGVYIVEDIVVDKRNLEKFDDYFKASGVLDGFMIQVPHKTNHRDNCIACFQCGGV